jgi:hypothetical protein
MVERILFSFWLCSMAMVFGYLAFEAFTDADLLMRGRVALGAAFSSVTLFGAWAACIVAFDL